MFSLDLGEQAALSLMQQYPQAIFAYTSYNYLVKATLDLIPIHQMNAMD